MMAKVNIEYKVRFGDDKNIPLSIVRLMEGDDLFVVELCNKDVGWYSNPDAISNWMGSHDGDWHSGPEAVDMPSDFVEKWINKWKVNWD